MGTGWKDPIWDISCNPQNFPQNTDACVARELCYNKNMAKTLQETENVNNGSQGKYYDAHAIYIETMWNTGNLAFGILIVLYMIYEYKNAE
jgi:hypothetical protein